MRKNFIVLILAFLSCITNLQAQSDITDIQAHTFIIEDFVCPIGGEEFSQTMERGTGSYIFSFGIMLDLKPVKSMPSVPLDLPVCPSNKFVMYRNDFTDIEIKILEAYIQDLEYQKIINETTYYRVAQFKKVLHEPTDEIASTLLEATWQLPSLPYLQEALDEYKKYLQQLERGKNKSEFIRNYEWGNAELITLELERRTGQFDTARQRLKKLSEIKMFNDDTNSYKKILNLQKKLINKKDKNQHEII